MMCMVFTSLIMSVIVCNITSVACTVYTWCIPIGSKIHIFLEYIAIQLTAAQPIDSELLLSSFLSFTLSLALYFSIAASPLPPLSLWNCRSSATRLFSHSPLLYSGLFYAPHSLVRCWVYPLWLYIGLVLYMGKLLWNNVLVAQSDVFTVTRVVSWFWILMVIGSKVLCFKQFSSI